MRSANDLDETSKQLIQDTRPVIDAGPGRAKRYDYEYKRNVTRNLFVFCEPKGGCRHLEITERRTAVDFAEQMRWLADEAYPGVGTIRVVLDNLNTHKFGSLYEAFEPAEARRIAKRLELRYTPKHGSWLNMAEIELSVFSRQCLKSRIGDEETLRRQIAALERERNASCAIIDCRSGLAGDKFQSGERPRRRCSVDRHLRGNPRKSGNQEGHLRRDRPVHRHRDKQNSVAGRECYQISQRCFAELYVTLSENAVLNFRISQRPAQRVLHVRMPELEAACD